MAIDEYTTTATVPASGNIDLSIRPGSTRYSWTVRQVATDAPGIGSGARCQLVKGANIITPLVPSGTAAGGDPPVTLRPGQSLTVRWTGATPGVPVKATFMYDDGQGP